MTKWLCSLARLAHEECAGPGVGAIGMCFTGGYALLTTFVDTWPRYADSSGARMLRGYVAAELNRWDADTFYTGGEKGYLDYPAL